MWKSFFFNVSFSVKLWIQVELGSDLDPDRTWIRIGPGSGSGIQFLRIRNTVLTRMNLECGVCGGQPRHVLPPAPQLVRDLRGEGGDVAHAI